MSATPVPNNGHQRRSNEEALKDFRFCKNNYDALVSQYTDQWIAVFGEQVVASAPDYFEMEAQVEAKGIAFNDTIRERMTKEEQEEYVVSDVYDPNTEQWQMVITHYRMRNGD